MKMKRFALLLACLLLATVLLTGCSAGDPKGTWQLVTVRNDKTGDWADMMADCKELGASVKANITSTRVQIYLDYLGYTEDMITFSYNLRGNRMIDPADNTEVTFSASEDSLTLEFADCELVFTKIN